MPVEFSTWNFSLDDPYEHFCVGGVLFGTECGMIDGLMIFLYHTESTDLYRSLYHHLSL